jgi:hypothetical protein
VDDLRDRLGAAAFASAVRRGSSLTDGEIVEFVRAQIRALAPKTTHGITQGDEVGVAPDSPDATRRRS